MFCFSTSVMAVEKYNFVGGNDSKFTQLCLAAAASDDALRAKISELNVLPSVLAGVMCNGRELGHFIYKYRGSDSQGRTALASANTNVSKES